LHALRSLSYTESHCFSLFMQISEQGKHTGKGTTTHGTSSRVTAFTSFNELNIGVSVNPPRLLLMTRMIRQMQTADITHSMVLLIQH
jgi:hypothetical protein